MYANLVPPPGWPAITDEERAANAGRWAIIVGHPSLCTCDDCQRMRVHFGYDTSHPLLTLELYAERRPSRRWWRRRRA